MRTGRGFAFLIVLSLVAPFARSSRAQSPTMTESERKSTARVAFTDGLKLQDDGKPAEALVKFELAEKYFDAPTHLLHIAECQALTGKLLESAETYETLTHKNLGDNPSAAFTDAQEHGRAELEGVKARIPTLTILTKPDAKDLKGLVITINGESVGADLVGLARPVNPGRYKLHATATGYKLASVPPEVVLAEKEKKEFTFTFVPGAATPVVVAPAPQPYNKQPPPPPPPPYQNKPIEPANVASSTGLLLGVSGGLLVPGGGITSAHNFNDVAGAGGQFAVDAFARLARMLLLGGKLEFGGLTGPSELSPQAPQGVPVTQKTSTFYAGVNIGILPNVDKVSFYGTLDLGYRHLGRTVSLADRDAKESFGGAEYGLDVGLMIPIGPIRLLPKVGVTAGSFSSVTTDCDAVFAKAFRGCVAETDGKATHVFITIGLGLLYHLDLASKPASSQ